MQYKNITLALVLLASTAIVSASSSEEALEAKIFAKVDSGSGKLTKESLAEFSLSDDIVQALVDTNALSAVAIKSIIESKADPAVVVDNAESSANQGADKVEEPVANQGADKVEEPVANQGADKVEEPVANQGADKVDEPAVANQGADKVDEPAVANQGADKVDEPAAANQGADKVEEPAANQGADKVEPVANQGADKEVTSNNSTLSETSIKPWYTSTLFMVACGVVGLSALGGGIYMMTNKSGNTDL
jgi:hypothetical protein